MFDCLNMPAASVAAARRMNLDAASALFVDVLGERGRHARAAFIVPRLPLNAAIELVVTFGTRL